MVAYQTRIRCGVASNFSILSSISIFYPFPETLKSPKMVIPGSDFTVGGIPKGANQHALLILMSPLPFSAKMNRTETDYFLAIKEHVSFRAN